MSKQIDDIRKDVVKRFIEALKVGAGPWRKPWTDTSQYSDRPVNAVTERRYTGMNITVLWSAAVLHGFMCDRWLTPDQVRNLGGRVRKGQPATIGVRTIQVDMPPRDGERRSIKLIRGFSLFNVEQCENLPWLVIHGPSLADRDPEWDLNLVAESFIARSRMEIAHDNDACLYLPKEDRIRMAPRCAFLNATDYYSTLFHEMTHWTGHASRLNRPGITSEIGVDTAVYAFEEMIAEIGSAMLSAILGIAEDDNSASYILSWIEVLGNDPNVLRKAALKAQDAVMFLMREGD